MEWRLYNLSTLSDPPNRALSVPDLPPTDQPGIIHWRFRCDWHKTSAPDDSIFPRKWNHMAARWCQALQPFAIGKSKLPAWIICCDSNLINSSAQCFYHICSANIQDTQFYRPSCVMNRKQDEYMQRRRQLYPFWESESKTECCVYSEIILLMLLHILLPHRAIMCISA